MDPSDPGAARQHCPKIAKCPMFPLFRRKVVLRIFQIRYCESDFTECARYRMATAGTMPDPRMLPDGDWLPPEP